MKYTSERINPEVYQNDDENRMLLSVHIQTYQHVLARVENKVVLDLGCGDGYGADILARCASEVVAVDVDHQSIESARGKYKQDNLSFQKIDPIDQQPLPFADNAFDVVVSFQVMEHIRDVDKYLKEIQRVLKSGGELILTTPNAGRRLLLGQNPWNKHHIREFTARDVEGMLGRYFGSISIWGQTLEDPWKQREACRLLKNKWILWPVTHKWIPEALRIFFLQTIWKIFKRTSQKKQNTNNNHHLADPVLIYTQEHIHESFWLYTMATKRRDS